MCLMQWLTVCSWHLKRGALGSIYDHCQVFISGYFISYVHHVVASCYPLCGFHGNAFGCVVHVRPDVQQLGKWSYTTLQYACGFFQVLVCSVCEHSFHGFPGTSVSVYGMECLGFIVYGLRCERQKAEVFILPPSPSRSSYASACETTISSQKHTPFEQTPSPLFNPQVLTLVFFPV